MPITVLIADDQAMVRQGFSALLAAQPDITVLGDAPDGAVAAAEAARLRVVIDQVASLTDARAVALHRQWAG